MRLSKPSDLAGGATAGSLTAPTAMALLVAVFAISSSAVLVVWAEASPVALAFWRTAGGALILAPAAIRSDVGPTGADRWAIAIAGLALAAHFSAWLASLELTSVAASVTLVSTVPLVVAGALSIGHRWRRRRRPTSSDSASGSGIGRSTWVLILLALLGATVIAFGDATGTVGDTDRSRAEAVAGDGLALLGAITMAAYLMLGERVRRRLPTSAYAARTYGVAAVALLFPIAIFDIDLVGFDTATWLAVIGMIVGPQLAGHTLLNFLLKRLGPVSVSLALLAEPLGASLLAWLLLSELPPAAVWVGGPLVLAAVAARILNPGEPPTDGDGACEQPAP